MIGFGFGDTRCHGTDTNFGHELHRNRGARIAIFQIVNQLRQVFDGINIVMRRRRNQFHTRRCKAQRADVFRNFVTRQLASFAGLGTLCHLDLDLIG